jgi:phage portal protein BeeE
VAKVRSPEVTTAQRPAVIAPVNAIAPGIAVTDVASWTSSELMSVRAVFRRVLSISSAMVSAARRPCTMSLTISGSRPQASAHRLHAVVTDVMESTSTPSLSKSTPSARTVIAA